jgi:hypothetical protein
MWSVALHQTAGGSTFSFSRSRLKSCVHFSAIAEALSPWSRAAFSILSSPWSASSVRCPTSVMLMTWRTS